MSDQYHSYSATIRVSNGRRFVRIIDRYWPGGPSPDYSRLVDLTPREARTLAEELLMAEARCRAADIKDGLRVEIAKNTAAIAAKAKEEAET